MAEQTEASPVVGGVDTHKDLHVAAVVDHLDRVLGTESFPTTRHGYRVMLAWMRSFGDLQRVGIECSGSYGAGLLRYLQAAGVEVLEVTAPDKHDRRRRGKNDDFDAESAAHAAFAERHTVTPRSRDGMVESLRVLRVCRKAAVQARRIALQMIQTTIVCAPDRVRLLGRQALRGGLALHARTRKERGRTSLFWTAGDTCGVALAYSAPLVDGMASALRASNSSASRRARATALNAASAMWWLLKPWI
jgi:transposase